MLFHKQMKGFTLIELVVAMAIGSAMSMAVIYMFLMGNDSYRQQQAISELQSNGRFGFQFLRQLMQNASFGMPGATPIQGDVTLGTSYSSTANSIILRRNASITNEATCTGDTVNAGETIVEVFLLKLDPDDSTKYILKCNSSTNGSAFGNEIELLNNVAAFKVQYGIDTVGDGEVDYILVEDNTDVDTMCKYYGDSNCDNSEFTIAFANAPQVIFVHFALVLQSELENISSNSTPITIFKSGGFSEEINISNGRMGQVFESTIYFPNAASIRI